jgi:hypothetical protein
MASHLLSCGSCGKALPVELGQAGGQIRCPCGATLDVPTLRQLRQLPIASAPAAETRRWSASKGALAACLVVTGLLVAVAAWSRWSEPVVQPFDPVKRNREMEQAVDGLTPAQGWSVWVGSLRPLRGSGFFLLDTGPPTAVKQQIVRARFFQVMILVLAGISALGAIVVAASRRMLRPPVAARGHSPDARR